MILSNALGGVVQLAFAGRLGQRFIFYDIVIGPADGQMGYQCVVTAVRLVLATLKLGPGSEQMYPVGDRMGQQLEDAALGESLRPK